MVKLKNGCGLGIKGICILKSINWVCVFCVKRSFFFVRRRLPIGLLSIFLFWSVFFNAAFAEVNHMSFDVSKNINKEFYENHNTEEMAVVLTPDDIKDAEHTDKILDNAKDVDDGSAEVDLGSEAESTQNIQNIKTGGNIKRSVENNVEKNSDTKIPVGNNAFSQNFSEQGSSIEITDITGGSFRQALPQVTNQTPHIGTPEQPTIDGGLISSPELVGMLSATAKNMNAGDSLTQAQRFIFMKLNDLHFLWDSILQYGLDSYELQGGLSRLKTLHENYTQKVRVKCIQVLKYWTSARTQHSAKHQTKYRVKRRVKGGGHVNA